jgi:aspartate aminotransferase
MLKLSKRIISAPESPIRKLAKFADQAKRRGIKVYHLNIGQPDIETPREMTGALKNFSEKIIYYTDSQGIAELLEAFLVHYRKLGVKGLKKENLIVTAGGSEGLLWAMEAVADAGEEIIVLEPFYANYEGFASLAGVKLVPVTTKIENGFHLPAEKEILEKISKKTKAILIANPNNPTGTIYTKNEIELLAKICKKQKLFLIVEPVYQDFYFEGKQPFFALNLEKKYLEQVVVVDSLSKRYSLCGARIGCLASFNKQVIENVLKYAQARLCAGMVDQIMAEKMIKIKASYSEKIRAEYKKRRDVLCEGLSKISGVKFLVPEGAFYLVCELPVDDAELFCQWLLTDFSLDGETVMQAPASGFYKTAGLGKKQVRIAYVLKASDLKKAMKILKIAIEKYISKASPRCA